MIIAGRITPTGAVVTVDGVPLDPAPSLKVCNHSPTGFSWGYGGSGPAQLALAVLLAAAVPPDDAVQLYQRFKWQYIAPLRFGSAFVLDLNMATVIAQLKGDAS